MRSRLQSFILALLTLSLTVIVGCNMTASVEPSASPVATVSDSVTSAQTALKFKQADGSEAFSIKLLPDGAKLVDAADVELARLTRDGNQKIKIKDTSDRPLGYVVPQAGYWKLENADQTQELFILRQQTDGDYKLEDGADQAIYRIKARDYGFEIETPDKQSLYKVKVKDGKISLRNSGDQTILSTRAEIPPIAIACFGFDSLNREQQAALAYAVYTAGGQSL